MPLLPTTTNFPSDPGFDLAIWHATESPNELLTLLLPYARYEAEYARIRSARRQREWHAARVLLHRILNVAAPIRYHESGRPYLEDDERSVSISHTHDYVAVAVSPRPIGIDIEAWGERAYKLRRRFLAPEELPLVGHPEHDAVLLWSAKEAVFKRFDRPGTTLGESIRISSTPDGLTGHIRGTDLRTGIRHIDFPEFVLTYTAD